MKLLTALALALGLATATLARPAYACGGYYPSPEDRVRNAFFSELPDQVYKEIHAIRFLADGRAEIELRWNHDEDSATAQLYWLSLDEDGQWRHTGTSYMHTVWLDDQSRDARKPAPKQQRIKRTRARPAVAAR